MLNGYFCYILSMTKSKYDAKINFFAEKPVFIAAEARKAGIPSRMLSHFTKKEIIKRISHGVYMRTKADLNIEISMERSVLCLNEYTKGFICLILAGTPLSVPYTQFW